MEEKIDIKAKTIKVDTGKGNAIKVTMSYGEQSTLEELLIASKPVTILRRYSRFLGYVLYR